MKTRILNFMDMLLFGARAEDKRPASLRRRTLRRSLFAIILTLTTVPLVITLGLSFYQYRALLNEETSMNAKWSAERARQTIEAFLGKLQAAIMVLSDAYSFEELSRQQTLSQVYSRLKQEHPGLVDLSIIGADGIQRAYAGPFDLQGKDYSGQDWFKQAISKDVYVSEVFLGFRKVPHFVVVINKQGPEGAWLLRASINSETLDNYLKSVSSDFIDDIFLISEEGELQSSTRYGMALFEKIPLPARSGHNDPLRLLFERPLDKPVIRAYGKIQGTPWVLVLDQQDFVARAHWVSFTSQLLVTVVVCALLSGLVIIRIASFIARRIVEAELAMESALSQTEHTNRLASIGRLAGGVAHEINNPLAIINEKAGLLMDILEISDDFPQRQRFMKHVGSLQKAVVRARDITHRLLGFARRLDQKIEQVPLNEAIREVLSFIGKEALYRNIKVELDLDSSIPAIQGDMGQVQQVILNIINNAMDAVPEHGRICIVTMADGQNASVVIEDSGPGMPEEVVQKIFEPFFTTKTGSDKTGTGLGLFITYGIVRKMGGDIVVHSAPGAGTTFHVIFPLQGQQNKGQ